MRRHFVFVTQEFDPVVPGGAGTVVSQLAQLLAPHNEVSVILAVAAGASNTEVAGVDVTYVEVPAADGTAAWFVERSRRVAHALEGRLRRSPPPALIEFTDFEAIGWWALTHRTELSLERTRLAVRVHGPVEAITSAVGCCPPPLGVLGVMERLVFSMADVVLVPSDPLGRWVVQRYEVEPRRVLVSPSPVPDVVTRPRHPVEPPTFVSYGRLTEVKGVGDLVSAMVPVFDAHPAARLVFVGADGWSLCEDRPMSEVLHERIPQRHRDKVVFTGRVGREAALDMLGSAWAVVNSSRFETFCLALHEARRAGAPVVAPDLPAFEGLDGHGVLKYDGSVGALTGLLEAIASDPHFLDSLMLEPVPRVQDGLSAYVGELPEARDPIAQAALATAAVQRFDQSARVVGGESVAVGRFAMRFVPRRLVRLAVRIVPQSVKDWLRPIASWRAEDARRHSVARRGAVLTRIKAGGFPELTRPEVSVVIPCFDQGSWIEDTVLSVFEQTHSSWEIVLVDDGSTDQETIHVLDLISEWPRVTLMRQENRGLPVARNVGMAASNGQYLVPLDADDELAPTFLEVMLHRLRQHPGAAYAHCWGRYFGDMDAYWLTRPFNRYQILLSNSVLGCVLMRADAWRSLGGYDETMLRGNEDWDLWLRMLEAGWDQVQVREVLFRYRIHGRTMSIDTLSRFEEERLGLRDRHPSLYAPAALGRTKASEYPWVTVLHGPSRDLPPQDLDDADHAHVDASPGSVIRALQSTRGKVVVDWEVIDDTRANVLRLLAEALEANPHAQCAVASGVPVAWRRWALHDPAAPCTGHVEVSVGTNPAVVPRLDRGIAPLEEWMVPKDLASSDVRVVRQPPEVEGALPSWLV